MKKFITDLPEEKQQITLTLQDDNLLVCDVVCIMSLDSGDYLVVMPRVPGGSEVYIYRYKEVDGEPVLDNIDDDDEYDIVCDAFDEFQDEQYFNEKDSQEE